MSERNLIAAVMASRDAYTTIADHLEEGDLSEQGNIIVQGISEYYERDSDAESIDADLLARNVGRTLSNAKHREMFDKLIATFGGADCSPANIVFDFIEVKREAAGARLASALAANKSADQVRPLLDEYNKWESCTSLDENPDLAVEVYKGQSILDLVDTTYAEGLIEVWPKALNDRLDGGQRAVPSSASASATSIDDIEGIVSSSTGSAHASRRRAATIPRQ